MLFTFSFLLLFGQRHTVNGYVSDASSGERLIGATVVDTVSGFGAVTNNSGFYSLTLPDGNVGLQCSYVGYAASQTRVFSLNSDTLVSFIISENTHLQEVTVVGHQSVSSPNSVQMSAIEVPVQQIKGIPALAGEVDVIKALQLLPGVQSGSEGSAGLYVRGGGPDENLIMLDGVPLYNVNHMMGFFSVFNADAVKNVTLYKGNFPARFGSRLSSVVDVRQNDGNRVGWHGNVSIGLISAKINAEGPIPWNKQQLEQLRRGEKIERNATTFNISARRTYFDLFTAPIVGIISRRETNGDLNLRAGYYFYDFNAKITHLFTDDDKLSLTVYAGDDDIYFRVNHEGESENKTDRKTNAKFAWHWGNLLTALNWEHRFSPRIFSNTQLSYTRYRYDLRQQMAVTSSQNAMSATMNEQMEYRSFVGDLMLQTNFNFAPSPKHEMRWGANYIFHQFRPQVSALNFKVNGNQNIIDDDFSNIVNVDTTLTDGTINAHEASVYIEDTYTPWRWLKLNLGLRGSLYSVSGKTYPSFEPRVGIRALAMKDLSIKASYAYMSQYIHLLSNSSVSLPTDLWVPVTKNIVPMRSMQVAGGVSYNLLGQVELSVEGYYKKMLNLIEYKDGASFMGSTTGWEEKVCMGEGWSYGVEFLAQRTIGKVTGWIGYTWSRAWRLFNREDQQINYGKPFPAKYDREHDLSITVQWAVNKLVDLNATFVYGTGNRATLGTQVYYDPNTESEVAYVPERNNYLMPDYHRLDIGATFHYPLRRHPDMQSVWNVSVYNVYNNMNPFLLYSEDNVMYKVTLFPILPSVSYTFKF